MGIPGKAIGKGQWNAWRTVAKALAVATSGVMAQAVHADSWAKHVPSLLGDVLSWNSVAVNEEGSRIAACSYVSLLGLGFEECFVYLSDDAGATWTRHDPAGGGGNRYLAAVAMDASGDKLVAGADGDYLYTSIDGGATWVRREPAGPGMAKPWSHVSISADGAKMAACAAEDGFIYISADDGMTWTSAIAAGSAFWRQVAWSADGTGIAAASDTAIASSADGGTTWTMCDPDPGLARRWTSIATNSDGTVLLASDATFQDGEFKGFLWTSADGGATWTKREPDGVGVGKTWREVDMSADGAMMMACDDANLLVLSYDGGASWAKPDPVGEDSGSAWRGVAISGDALFLAASGDFGKLYTRPLSSVVADPFFNIEYLLPQTLSKEHLSRFLSMGHPEYHLDGWFFFGNLIEGRGTPVTEDVSTFFISIQRKDIAQIPGTSIRFSVYPSIVAFQGARHEGYLFGGGLDGASQVTVASEPWSVVAVANGHPAMMSMSLVKGQMGMRGAVYHLASDVVDQEGHRLQTDVWIKDKFGIINDGYGPASFFPQWILPGQREKILAGHGGSLESYLYAERDLMTGQGDYYYSSPSLKVLDFKITRDYDEILAAGSRGELWLDYTVASYDDRASDMIKGCKWQFFTIQLTGSNGSILLLNTETATTGSLPVARLYRKKRKGQNGAIHATYTWDIDKISIVPDEDPAWAWKSPDSQITYHTRYNIALRSEVKKHNVDLTVTMLRENSEIYIPGQNPAYEGVGLVTGTMGSRKVKGYAFAEFEVDTGL